MLRQDWAENPCGESHPVGPLIGNHNMSAESITLKISKLNISINSF